MSQVLLVLGIVCLYTLLLHWFSSSPTLTQPPRAPEIASPSPTAAPHDRLAPSAAKTVSRRNTIVKMTLHAWRGYMSAAAGADEVRPLSNTSSNRWGNIGVTPIDSLDTLQLMGLEKEFQEARALVKNIDMSKATKSLSVFETIIRHVGGGLSAFAATNDTTFLDFAQTTLNGLLHAFEGPLSFPAHTTKFGGTKDDNGYMGKRYMLAEFGSFQMELRYMSHITGDKRYEELCNVVNEFLFGLKSRGWPSNPKLYEPDQPIMPHKGLFPTYVSFDGKFYGAAGYAAMMDSFYEYLLKQWIQFGKKDDKLLELYEDAVEGMLEHLLKYTEDSHIAILGYLGHTYHPTMDHLACFVPGMLILGAMHGAHDYAGRNRPFQTEDVVAAAEDIAATCYRFYVESPLGLSPDVVEFSVNGSYTARHPKYILRPEVIESIFYLYRYTHDERYRDWGWRIAKAINTYAKAQAGFTAIDDVTAHPPVASDSMESFFIAETLKYLYLLFSDDSVLPLDQWVFTTEAHPLPIIH